MQPSVAVHVGSLQLVVVVMPSELVPKLQPCVHTFAVFVSHSGEPVGLGGGVIVGFGSVLVGFVPGGSVAVGSVAGGLVRGGFVPGGFVAGGFVAGGFVPGGIVAGGFVTGGSVPGGSVAGGSVAGGFVPGGSVPGGSVVGRFVAVKVVSVGFVSVVVWPDGAGRNVELDVPAVASTVVTGISKAGQTLLNSYSMPSRMRLKAVFKDKVLAPTVTAGPLGAIVEIEPSGNPLMIALVGLGFAVRVTDVRKIVVGQGAGAACGAGRAVVQRPLRSKSASGRI